MTVANFGDCSLFRPSFFLLSPTPSSRLHLDLAHDTHRRDEESVRRNESDDARMNFFKSKTKTPPEIIRSIREAIARLDAGITGAEGRRKVCLCFVALGMHARGQTGGTG